MTQYEAEEQVLQHIIELSNMVENGELSASAAKKVYSEWAAQPGIKRILANFGEHKS